MMRGHQRSDISVPTPEQNRRAAIIKLRQTETAVLLRNLDPERAECGEPGEIFRRNFPGTVDLVRIDMFVQISFEFLQKIRAGGLVVFALGGVWMNPVE